MQNKQNKKDNSVIFSVADILRKRFQNKSKNIVIFSKIKKVFDDKGNILAPESGVYTSGYCKTNTILNSGDVIKFKVNASSIDNSELEFSLDIDYRNVIRWQKENEFTLKITDKNISKFCQIRINVRNKRNYQPMNVIDDSVIFSYQVVPAEVKVESI